MRSISDFRFLILAIILIFAASCSSVADVRQDLDSLANQARYIADEFMQQSVELRLGYEYRQGFTSDADAQSLRQLARKATSELEDILRQQEKMKKQIENYSGEDWDRRYGDSGVWRMLTVDICSTVVLRCQIDCYLAAASPQHEQAGILNNSLDQLSRLPESANVLLVKADVYSLLGRSDQGSKELAAELYRKILIADKTPDEIYFPAAVAAQKLNPPESVQVLDELAARILRSKCKDNFELNMTLAFLQRRSGSTAVLAKAVRRWPQARVFVGRLILSDLMAQPSPRVSGLSVFDVDCVAAAALQDNPAKYQNLLEAMSQTPDFQTGRILYAAAIANSEKSPAMAIELFIKASGAAREPNDGYEPPAAIAKQGAVLALNFFKNEPAKCELVKHAVENYFALADNLIDEKIEYSYGDVLSDCGDSSAAEKLLQKIAARTGSAFGRRARLDLLTLALNKETSFEGRIKVAGQLSDLIKFFDSEPQVCIDAKTLYCRVMLDTNSPQAAQTVINVLETAPKMPDSSGAIFKSQALFQLGHLSEAAKALVAADVNVCDCQVHAINLLMRYADRIDEYAQSDSNIETFHELGCRVIECSDEQGPRYVVVLYAQAAVFAAHSQRDKLDAVEKVLDSLDRAFSENNMDVLTVRARLTAALGNYEEAAKRWGAICEMLKAQPSEPLQHSWHWWQAKYFELENSLKMPNASRGEITHSVEVLQSSFNQIPPFWDKKLRSLAAQ
jgi:hypothetical protein